MAVWLQYCRSNYVAPVRERGLKSADVRKISSLTGRSREGAWIEIASSRLQSMIAACRSREGAWIEICFFSADSI